MTIVIAVEGGLVQSVSTDDPAEVGKQVIVIDHDTDDADPNDHHLFIIPYDDGEREEAYAAVMEIEKTSVLTGALLAVIEDD